MIHNLVIGTKITNLCFKWEFDSVMAAVDLFPEHAAGKVGHGKRMAVIETRHLELLDPKKSSGPMPIFD